MRIVSWNCCWQKEGFTGEKRNEILKLNPDILIVQECKQDDWKKLNYSSEKGDWYGDDKDSQGDPNKKLGIGIFCKNEKYSIDCSLFRGKDLSNKRYVIPYKITGAKEPFVLYAVWTKKPPDSKSNYHTPVYNVLGDPPSPIENAIFIGDFNTGSIQRATNARWYNDLKYRFAKNGFLNCANGQEWVPTFFRGRSSWLDDHCFATDDFKVISFGIGNRDYWQEYSDHCPIIVDFAF